MVELQLREGQIGLGLAQAGRRALDLGLLDRDLTPLTLHAPERGAGLVDALPGLAHREHAAGDRGLRLLHFLLGLVEPPSRGLERGRRGRRVHLRLIEVPLGHEAALEQRPHPLLLPRVLAQRAFRADHLRGQRGHRGALGLDGGPRLRHRGLGALLGDLGQLQRGARLLGLGARGLAGQLGLGAGGLVAGERDTDRGPGLIAPGLVVAWIDAEEELTRLHRAVVVHVDLGDVARDLGADDDDAAFHVGIVGGDALEALPPGIAAPAEGGEGHQHGQADQTPVSHRGVCYHPDARLGNS